MIHVADHQPKAQFVDIARQLLAAGLLDPLALETGDTELYLFAGMLAAVVISIRVFLFRGAGRAN